MDLAGSIIDFGFSFFRFAIYQLIERHIGYTLTILAILLFWGIVYYLQHQA